MKLEQGAQLLWSELAHVRPNAEVVFDGASQDAL